MKTITTKNLDTQIKSLRTKISNAIPYKERMVEGKIQRYKRTPYTITYSMLSECEKFIHSFGENGTINIDEKALRKAKKEFFEKSVREYSL